MVIARNYNKMDMYNMFKIIIKISQYNLTNHNKNKSKKLHQYQNNKPKESKNLKNKQ